MKLIDDLLILSASDLSAHASCKHLTNLDLAVVKGDINAPEYFDPAPAILQERGREFEEEYLKFLQERGCTFSEPNSVESTFI
ncbi:MAG: hypothetical protein ACK4WD_08510 [Flavobacteriales bacterium]|jgi:hypothetical protein